MFAGHWFLWLLVGAFVGYLICSYNEHWKARFAQRDAQERESELEAKIQRLEDEE